MFWNNFVFYLSIINIFHQNPPDFNVITCQTNSSQPRPSCSSLLYFLPSNIFYFQHSKVYHYSRISTQWREESSECSSSVEFQLSRVHQYCRISTQWCEESSKCFSSVEFLLSRVYQQCRISIQWCRCSTTYCKTQSRNTANYLLIIVPSKWFYSVWRMSDDSSCLQQSPNTRNLFRS